MFPESIVVDMRGVTASAMLGYLVRFIQHIHFALYQHRIQSISNGLVVLSAHEEMINGAAFFTLQETTWDGIQSASYFHYYNAFPR